MGKILGCHWSLFVLALLFFGVAFLSPGESFGDVSEPADISDEDLAGVVLLTSNAMVSIYLGIGLKSGKKSNARGLLGVGLGAISIALGVTDNTSLSGGVAIAGAVSLTLGVLNFIGDGRPQKENEQEFDLSREFSVSPLIVKAKGDELGLGLLLSASF